MVLVRSLRVSLLNISGDKDPFALLAEENRRIKSELRQERAAHKKTADERDELQRQNARLKPQSQPLTSVVVW
jgi:hypothetical protein